MNRPIKFRAWDLEGKKMLRPYEFNYSFLQAGDFTYFKPMQFTGLTDKNGKDIYEGDVCRWSSWKRGSGMDSPNTFKDSEVTFDRGAWVFRGHETWNAAIYDNVEVVGNIYENPELLSA